MPQQDTAYLITVEWCKNGRRGIFCSKDGKVFRKDGKPHTDMEIFNVLGPFFTILDPQSELFTEEQVTQYTAFRSLAEYTYQYGIAFRKET